MHHAIERLGPGDIAAMQEVWRRAGLHFRPDGRDSIAHLGREVEAGTAILFGARSDGDLVGVVVATHDGRKGWINRLAVDPSHRRIRIGLALIDAAEAAFAALDIGLAAALVEEGNESSNALFAAAGYTTHPVTYYRKPLSPAED